MATTTIFFDLDGTLTDPAEGITGCIQHALERLGAEVPSKPDLTRFIGPPLSDTFSELLDTRDEQRVAEAIVLYRERFGPVGLFENSVYSGIPETLGGLRERGLELYVVTSKPHVYARKIVEHFDLAPFFREIYGAELDGTRTHKNELIEWVLEREGLDSSEAFMIGDRGVDMSGAHANGVIGVGVLWGYGSREELEEAGAQTLLGAPEELLRYAAEHDS